ncbi:PepSY domain-containing protein [Algoriphagus sp.]|uniref:PepSY-associated TM helix domain-containing protein n=1 Tax=Algoriphagus sp. TaxID=1872435 RepID=UPI0025D738BE|nr:PepSY-associated TM helix domain-containing protein [Algoriphagus sp.]
MNLSTIWKSIRNIANEIHLYAGLISGIIVIAVCLSGTIYVYNSEIRELSNPELYQVEKSGSRLLAEDLKLILESKLDSKVVGVNWNNDPYQSVQFTLKKEEEKGRGTTYFINPYSAEVLGDASVKTSAAEFMGYMFSLHRWLMLDRIEAPILESMSNRDLGRLINGIATLLFTLGVITGIVLWVPKKVKNWKQGLKVKWNANWKRVNHDLHNTLAFYSLIFLLLMGATGPFWSFQWYREGWQKTWDTYRDPNEKSEVLEEPKPLIISSSEIYTLDEIMEASNKVLPYKGIYRISLPENQTELVTVSKYKTGFFARSGSDQVKINPNSMEVVEANLFSELPFRQQVGRSVKSLHTGDIFGQFTKFIWFIACLIATSLPISGTLIWLNKKKKKTSKKKPVEKRNLEMA